MDHTVQPLQQGPPERRGGSSAYRIAVAHDWLVGYRGGEGVLDRVLAAAESLGEVAGLFVMFDDSRPLTPRIDATPRTVATLGRLPLASATLRRWLFPLYPMAVAELSRALAREHARRPIDLVVSTSSAAIKGLRPPTGVAHVCYCHSPARYAWSQAGEYGRESVPRRAGLAFAGPAFRRWDRATAGNVTRFLANSTHTASEIRRCYGREAEVLFPPIRPEFFGDAGVRERGDHWLLVGALEPYKRADLAIQAANQSGHELRVVGSGSDERRLRALAGPSVRFLGRVSDERLRAEYASARLLLFPQVEDFGIIAVEAQACGLPVVARRAGGALDSVVEGRTGSFFDEASPGALLGAIARCPSDEAACRANAARFHRDVFDARLREIMERDIGAQGRKPRAEGEGGGGV